jgi:hypothetical protein
VSHHTHRSEQPVSRMNAQGKPARVDSPWIDRKISVTRTVGSTGSLELRAWAGSSRLRECEVAVPSSVASTGREREGSRVGKAVEKHE